MFYYIDGIDLFTKPVEPWLPTFNLNVGIPYNSIPAIKILSVSQEVIKNIFIQPTPDSLNQPFNQLPYDKKIYSTNEFFPHSSVSIDDFIVRYARVASVNISPYQFNPISREVIFNKKIIVRIDFNINPNDYSVINKVNDLMTDNIIKTSVINYSIAKEFVGKIISSTNAVVVADTYWYNPSKDYYKIYLDKEGVYRITYDMLINEGVPANGLENNQLELFNNGISIPIDVVDVNSDNLFNSGDYFQFVGVPATPQDQFTRMNIYNLSNVYWFSYQADSLNYYKSRNGSPTNTTPFITNSIKTLRWEEDLSFQRFGHANNSQRDYWYWGSAEARNRLPAYNFTYLIRDSISTNFVEEKPQVQMRIGLHGLTENFCDPDHNASILFNTKTIGSIIWDGTESAEFTKNFYLAYSTLGGGDTAQIYFTVPQQVIVQLNGDICSPAQSDIVLINYIEFDYWRWHKTYPNYFFFKSPPNNYDENIYYLYRWMRDNMKVYIPSRVELISNPFISNDADFSVRFQDTITVQTDYYCVADDYYQLPDSITKDFSSDLRNLANGADYIIVTHPEFMNAAERLAEFRSNNLSGYSVPRIKLVDIFDIYDEFSYGLLTPYALKDFAQYVFENWEEPAPAFITLLGDASYDYRSVYLSSRKNFIPSIPFHGFEFGQLPSDNSIVAVSGGDIKPDIAIGRLSCETIEEANNLVDKVVNYPADNSKLWKENVILLASGLSYQDQIQRQFNSYSDTLENNYIIPNGISTTKVFNFPEPHQIAFQGDGPRMREEINKGAVLVNYYGHGGGGQWDLIFRSDDIPELTNSSRLPFISSITCYTAHFDNAESFGEVFTKIPNKGAIGFWGSTSLTWWPTGHFMNASLFNHIFSNRNYVVGSAILAALTSSGSSFNSMIPQISYLGDPAIELAIPKNPDFEIKSSDITIFPQNPLKDDTVLVSINIRNLGITFPDDSVIVELYKNIPDTPNLIGEKKISSFGQNANINFQWIPLEAGLFDLIVRVNEKDIIEEVDHSDNIASRSFSVYDFGEPNIIKPVNGFFNQNSRLDFLFSDIGFYFDRNFNYVIQINNSPDFNNVTDLIQSPILSPVDGLVKWQTQSLAQGEYFWRAVIYDAVDTNYSPIKIFSIANENGFGYLSKNKQLQMFDINNMQYSEQLNSLVLNTEVKPPHPDSRFFLDSIMYSLPADSTQPVTFTTDGTYFYFVELPFWKNTSKIYKIGTGLNGTIAGQNYGAIPNLFIHVYSQLFCMNGYLYTSTGPLDNLLQINPDNGDTTRISVPDSLLLTLSSPTQWGGCYFYFDGQYLYNLAMGTSLYPNKFVLRKFNPSQNWNKMEEDIILNGNIIPMVMSFIVVNGYLVVYENYNSLYLRRYKLSDGTFEEEWAYAIPARDYYTMTYDYQNNFLYFALFSPVAGAYEPGFTKYQGTFIEAKGNITSQEIGPASLWYDLQFDIDQTNSNGTYKAFLESKNRNSGNWEILDTLLQPGYSLSDLNANEFDYIKLNLEFVDSSFGSGEPIKFNSLKVNYEYLPEISMIPKDLTFSTDSMLQGIDVNMNLKVNNFGYVPVDSLRLDFYMNDGDSSFFTKYISVVPDSFEVINQTLKTDTIIFNTKIKTIATTPIQEFYYYNNQIENGFYVARDSVKPAFKITFDGKEILDGDIVSAQPEVLISIKDNSPLPLDESLFTIVYDNDPIAFIPDTLEFDYIPYPNSEAIVTWTPTITEDGGHTLEVLAKDASGNFFDTTSYRISFNVFNESDLKDVYNFPNPFKSDTYFTFELRGINVPDELKIKIFTIAGRLIMDISLPQSALQIGFNRILWDGRDQDGDEIANGLYFYKMIYKNNEVVKTVTNKLAKVK